MTTVTEKIQNIIASGSSEKPKIALDTNCVQYYLSNPPVQPWADCLDFIFDAASKGKIDLYISG